MNKHNNRRAVYAYCLPVKQMERLLYTARSIAMRSGEAVFVVQHVHEFDDEAEDVKMIGVYSTQEQAEQAVARLRSREGFCDTPDGFHISRYPLDVDHWTEGYITV